MTELTYEQLVKLPIGTNVKRIDDPTIGIIKYGRVKSITKKHKWKALIGKYVEWKSEWLSDRLLKDFKFNDRINIELC